MLALLILVLGVFSRIVFHIPNFTPVIALALFSGVYLNRRLAVIVPVSLMILADCFIGFHDTIFFTWAATGIIAVMGLRLRHRKQVKSVAASALLAAVLFFAVTNFGAWLSLYPKTWEGFVRCYVLAIPFFRNTLLSTLVYSLLCFGLYEAVAARVRKTRYAETLLSA